MISTSYSIVLVLPDTGVPALPGGPFRLGVTSLYRMETPLPDFHLPGYPRPDLFGPADAQRLCNNNVGEDKEYLGVPNPIENSPSFHCQDGRESVPHCS